MRFCNPGTKLIVSKVFITCYRFIKSAGANCKNHDKLINYTVRVSKSDVVFLSLCRISLDGRIPSFFLVFGQYPGLETVDYNLSDPL